MSRHVAVRCVMIIKVTTVLGTDSSLFCLSPEVAEGPRPVEAHR